MTSAFVDTTLNRVAGLETSTAQDAELLAGIVRGERHALELLYVRHAPWLIARLSRRCSDAGLIDEVIQDTFVAVWRGASQWNSRGEVAAWIWGIAIRRLIDALRRRPDRTVPLNEGTDFEGTAEASAEDQAIAGGEFGDVAQALCRLPPELYLVVRATVLDGLTTREAAQLLGIPVGTVKTRMMRARMILRMELT